MREKFHSEPPAGYDPAAPWNSTIRESAYSLTNGMAEWWYFEVVAPLTYHGPDPQAAVASFEGLAMSTLEETATRSNDRSAKRKAPPQIQRRRHHYRTGADPIDVSHEICRADNAHKCEELCPTSRRHICMKRKSPGHPSIAPRRNGAIRPGPIRRRRRRRNRRQKYES